VPGLLNSLGRCWMRIGALAVSLAACGPVLPESPAGPGVPRISDLERVPYRVIAGCPAMVQFHFEDLEGDVSRAVAHWTVAPYREYWNLAPHRRPPTADWGTMTITVRPATFAGKTSGQEVQSRLTIVSTRAIPVPRPGAGHGGPQEQCAEGGPAGRRSLASGRKACGTAERRLGATDVVNSAKEEGALHRSHCRSAGRCFFMSRRRLRDRFWRVGRARRSWRVGRTRASATRPAGYHGARERSAELIRPDAEDIQATQEIGQQRTTRWEGTRVRRGAKSSVRIVDHGTSRRCRGYPEHKDNQGREDQP
jgi:hypothetical protein